MLSRSPCAVYIKYLLVHPMAFETSAIVQALVCKGLDFLSEVYINELRAELALPTPFYPLNKAHRASQEFIRNLRVYYLFHPDDAVRMAVALLESAAAKETLECMLATRDMPDVVVAFRMKHLGYKCTPDAVARYRFFFFDVEGLSHTDLIALVRARHTHARVHIERSDDAEGIRRSEAMRRANYDDPLLRIVTSPVPGLANVMNQVRLGFYPSQVELGRVLRVAQLGAATRATEALFSQRPDAASDASSFAITARVIGEILENTATPDDDLAQQLQQLAMKSSQESLPTIGELSGGDHTVDIVSVDASGRPDVSDIPAILAEGKEDARKRDTETAQ